MLTARPPKSTRELAVRVWPFETFSEHLGFGNSDISRVFIYLFKGISKRHAYNGVE
jgi:hypothetical protein